VTFRKPEPTWNRVFLPGDYSGFISLVLFGICNFLVKFRCHYK